MTGRLLISFARGNPASNYASLAAAVRHHARRGILPTSVSRELNILIHRGENIKPRNEIKKCMLCGKCILVCPRGVNTRNVVFLAKQAFQKFDGYAV